MKVYAEYHTSWRPQVADGAPSRELDPMTVQQLAEDVSVVAAILSTWAGCLPPTREALLEIADRWRKE